MPDRVPSPQLEIAHVLFMDLVGYSRLPMEEQPRQVAELQDLVRGSAEFCRAEASGELLCLPTGDGMALVFFRDPVAPLECSLQIGRAVRSRPHLRLRMGLHSGPVYRVADINASLNISGGGINLAQRVMDCGDAGHILLSSVIRELLAQVGPWPVHDLGECEVKHGERLHLFNLYTEDAGNPAPPERLRSIGRQSPSGSSQLPAPSSQHRELGRVPASEDGYPLERSEGRVQWRSQEPAVRAQRVVLLYKRNVEVDERLLKLLETRLAGHGFRVFVDRHLQIGVEWAKEIEEQVRTADAVIPLLSAFSVSSEMLQYEVQLAHEAAQERGRPRLLPVRVNSLGPLPEPLAGCLDRLEYALWEGPADDERLVAELVDALLSPPEANGTPHPVAIEPVGGAVALDSQLYIVRRSDEEFGAAISRQDSIVLVKGARQMGKTSLLARSLQRAREAGARIFLTDFQMLNVAHLESPDALFRTLADAIADQLDLETVPEEVWEPRRGPNINLQRYLQRVVLREIPGPIIWGMDEVDRLFQCSFASEVFGLFRSWHNARSLDPTGPWSRLTLAIAYATEHHLFITDVNQSPFNVGTRLSLTDFELGQVAELNRRHGSPLQSEAEVARFFRLVGGQPYLVRRGLLEMVTHGIAIAALEAQADRDEGIFGDHLRRILVLLVKDPELCDVLRGVLDGKPCPTPESFYRLRSAGILSGESAQNIWPRCQLYATYLRRHLS